MKNNKQLNLERIRHSLAHIMAYAVQELYSGTKFGIGPVIENGFYYDFDFVKIVDSKRGSVKGLEGGGRDRVQIPNSKKEFKLTPEYLPRIEKEIRELIKQNLKFEKKEILKNEAKKIFKYQPYKLELIKEMSNVKCQNLTAYQCGNFIDFCKGPHVKTTKEINPDAFKLTKVAGAYWKGDEKNKMLTRIYGIAFETKKELEDYLKLQTEAEKRDHRKIGKELDLFVFSDLVGKGLPLFTPKGATIMRTLARWIEDEEIRRGYLRTWTPDITSVELYKISGHLQHYKDDMYPSMKIHGGEYIMRPMTCPHQFEIYKSQSRSYKDLPLRYAEISKLYRHEKSGELSGLIRHGGGWSFADAHIICLPEQVENEFEGVIELIQYCMKTLGIIEYGYRFSKWNPKNPEKKYVDDPKSWEATQTSMKKILDKMKLNYIEAEDEAAFYGPKLDIQLRRISGQEETAFTVQIDFSMPERFGMTYIDKEGKEKRPMVIHRSSIGCLERTLAFVIEKNAGVFPVWLAPIQVQIIPVSETHLDFSKKIADEFKKEDIRIEVDDQNETVGYKIRKAEKMKIPYMLVLGDKEVKGKYFNIRVRGQKEILKITKKQFIEKIKKETENK